MPFLSIIKLVVGGMTFIIGTTLIVAVVREVGQQDKLVLPIQVAVCLVLICGGAYLLARGFEEVLQD